VNRQNADFFSQLQQLLFREAVPYIPFGGLQLGSSLNDALQGWAVDAASRWH
jgi:hypothetical protein